MAFVGPMTLALALGALALFDDEDAVLPRRTARIGRLTWLAGPPAVLRRRRAVHAGRPAPAHRRHASSCVGSSASAGSATPSPASVVMLPYLAGFVAFLRPRRPAPLQGAPLPQHGRHPVRHGDAGQGARGARAAGDRLPGLSRVHLELEAAAARADRSRHPAGAAHLRGGGGALAPRDAGPPRLAVLGRALRRQPLAAAGHRPPRRSRQLRVLPARARLRDVALDRARARGARRGGDAARGGHAAAPRRCGARESSGSARSGSWPPTRWCRCR